MAAATAAIAITTLSNVSDSLALPLIAVGTMPLVLAPFVRVLATQQEETKERGLRAELRERTREFERFQRLERDPVDQFVDINLANLENYYAMVGRHTNRSFLVSVLAGLIGFALLVMGVSLGLVMQDQSDKLVGYLTAGAGILIQFISAIFFYLYRRTVSELKTYHERLLRVQNTLIAFRYVKGIENETERSRTLGLMVAALVAREAVEAAGEDNDAASGGQISTAGKLTALETALADLRTALKT